MPLGDPPNPFTTPIAFTSQSDVTLQTILTELRTIRQLLEKAEQRAEREEEEAREWLNAYGRRATYERRDPAVEGQRAMMAGEK